jgi:hypothetical protein
VANNKRFIASATTQAWLSQFDPAAQGDMVKMLQAMRLVTRDHFADSIRTRLLQVSDRTKGRIGLYVEREIPPKKSPPAPLFQQSEVKPRRAFGPGPGPIQPAVDQPGDVGSEGIVAQLVSELCRELPDKFVSHPGPDALRSKKKPIKSLILVTDLIGSGERAERYLNAAWRVFSFKSWWSGRRSNGLTFDIVAYAATASGKSRVLSHRLSPCVRLVTECPTIDTAFDAEQATVIKRICAQYNPHAGTADVLGYQNTGALIAFAHGAPNNCPRILHKSSASWTPLFARRVTAATRSEFPNELDQQEIQQRLVNMRHKRLSEGHDWSRAAKGTLETYLVLAALSHPPRTIEVVARRTGLTFLETESFLFKAIANAWVDKHYRLTDQGQAHLRAAKKKRRVALPVGSVKMYYPSALRVPA